MKTNFLNILMALSTLIPKLITFYQEEIAKNAAKDQQIADLNAQLAASMANDAADAQAIADAQAAAAEAQAVAEASAARVAELQQAVDADIAEDANYEEMIRAVLPPETPVEPEPEPVEEVPVVLEPAPAPLPGVDPATTVFG